MKHLRMSEYNVYTDGSRIDGQCGAGFSIYKYKTNIASNCANLPTTSTVFQAEIIGIKLACEELIKIQEERNVKYVKIFSDSQAAVAALDSNEITSQAVKDARTALNKLAGTTKHTVLVWIKAHVGHVGNEAADQLAKQGTVSEKSIKIGIPHCEMKRLVEDLIRKKWDSEWNEYEESTIFKSSSISRE